MQFGQDAKKRFALILNKVSKADDSLISKSVCGSLLSGGHKGLEVYVLGISIR